MTSTPKEPIPCAGWCVRIAPSLYAADVIGDELLAAVLRELPSDDPIRPALAALPAPVAFINSDPRHLIAIIAERAFDWLRALVLHPAESDAAFRPQAEALAALADRPTIASAQEYERWAQASANLLRDPSERMLATHVSLAMLALGRGDDRNVVDAAAKVLVHSRSWSGYLLMQDVTELLHRLGFADRT